MSLTRPAAHIFSKIHPTPRTNHGTPAVELLLSLPHVGSLYKAGRGLKVLLVHLMRRLEDYDYEYDNS